MVRQTLLNENEVDDFFGRYIDKSGNPRYLVLRQKDALEALAELKALQIPLVGIELWYAQPDGNLVQATGFLETPDDYEDPNWITVQLGRHERWLRRGDPDHVGEEPWMEFVLPDDRVFERMNRSKAIAEAIRLPPIQWPTSSTQSGG